jgi:ParB family chromosome partitioning protein
MSRDWVRVQEQISDGIGLPVVLKQGRGSAGDMTIRFSSLEELDGLIARLLPQGLSEH